MEIMIVIAIIGLLVAIVLPTLNEARDKALVAKIQIELDTIKTTFAHLYDDTGRYPNGATSYCRSTVPAGNEVDLTDPNAGILGNGSGWAGWLGPYLASATDPWGRPYYLDEDYQCMASTTGCGGLSDVGNDSSVLVSCGPNGALSDGACAYDGDNVVYRLCDT
jgi:type II secretory pathway pseudopilin PulG